jgi:hypothetical protein
MIYKGIEYTVFRSPTHGYWDWRFQIGEQVKTGKTETKLELMAIRRVKTKIDHALRDASDGIVAATRTKAKIYLDGGINGRIIDLSETEATIEVTLPSSFPVEFLIEIEGESEKRCCAVAWTINKKVGVLFV